MSASSPSSVFLTGWVRRQFRASSARNYSPGASMLLIAPLALLFAFGFLYPVGRLVVSSFFTPEFGFDNYVKIVERPLYIGVLLRTMEIALIVVIAGFLLGYPVAMAMARIKNRWALLVAAGVLIPLWTSVLVRSYAWIILLQRKGIINNALVDAGVVSQPLKLLYTESAVILAMTHVLLPFMILPIYATLRTIPRELPQAARNLGAGAVAAFFNVTLPLSLPGVFAGCIMTFILALGFYITPALVGGPSTLMMATLIGQQATVLLDWPFAAALATVLLVATLLLVAMFRRALSFSRGFDDVN